MLWRCGGWLKLAIAALGVVVFAGAAGAFNSELWLQKREAMTEEALRLRAAYTNCAARLETPAENVTVPVETFESGEVKSIIYAKRAQYFLSEGLVWAEGVVAKKYKQDGRLDAVVEAEHCVIDRFAKAGWAEGRAKVVHGDTVFRGKGVYFSSPESYIKVWEESDIESKDLKIGGAIP